MSLGNLFGGGDKKREPDPLPAPVSPQPLQEDAKKKIRQGAAGRTQTVFTSPLGASGAPNSEGKQLLGQ